jgi:hypothetical protein
MRSTLLVLVLVFLGFGAPAWAQVPVDLELVLAVDVSRSIDAEEYDLQKQGYARAITDPKVLGAIRSGMLGAIAMTYVEWSGSTQQQQVVEWAVIRDAASAEAFATSILAAPRSFAAYTSISGAIDFSLQLFGRNQFDATRRVIDVSGDGSNNSGRPVWMARDYAIESGVTINGLVIMNDRPNPIGRPEPKLDDYYRDQVIGGDGAFLMAVEDFQSFANAILAKLIKEIARLPDAPDQLRIRLARGAP